MSQTDLIIEFYCLPCDSEKEITGVVYKKIKEIQEGFEDEWKEEDICWDCARSHQRSLGGFYTEEECLEQEKKFREMGMKFDGKRWVCKSGAVAVSYRVMNKIKKNKM